MRRLLLIFGLLALLATSVLCTLYLVNHPLRTVDESKITVGVTEPTSTIQPTDIFSPPTPQKGKTLQPGSLDGPEPATSRPQGYMLAYPEWDTSEARVEGAQAVTEAGQYVKPVWSPVGLDIAFTKEDFAGLYLGAAKPGSPPRLLAPDAGLGKEFQWTPDGMSLMAVSSKGSEAEFLITGERFPERETEKKVFIKDDRVFINEEDGTAKQISGLEDRFTEPVLSPDGLKVLYRGRETGLYIGLADGTRVIFVGAGRNASWLPDSRAIVFDRPVSDGTLIVDGDLWLATVDGRQRTNITNTPGIVEAWPSVAPDGQRIAFTANGAVYVGTLVRP